MLITGTAGFIDSSLATLTQSDEGKTLTQSDEGNTLTQSDGE